MYTFILFDIIILSREIKICWVFDNLQHVIIHKMILNCFVLLYCNSYNSLTIIVNLWLAEILKYSNGYDTGLGIIIMVELLNNRKRLVKMEKKKKNPKTLKPSANIRRLKASLCTVYTAPSHTHTHNLDITNGNPLFWVPISDRPTAC